MEIRELMHRDVVTVKDTDTLALALQLMRWNGIRHLPVMGRDGRLMGMLSEVDVLAYVHADEDWRVHGAVADVMTQPVTKAPPTLEVEEAAAMMVAERIDALPVVDAGDLVGIVTSTDVLGHIAQCEVPAARDREPSVGSLMIRRVQAVHDDDPLLEAASRMVQYGIRHLPVVDGAMRVKGMLSERDVREATGRRVLEASAAERGGVLGSLRVRDAMTVEPRTLEETAPISSAIQALVEDRVGALPIVGPEDELLGILSYVDLLRYLAVQLAEAA